MVDKNHAYEQLKDWILYTEIPPGTAINERELAERLGITRTPLREILQKLSYQGLVRILPHKGAVIAPIDYQTILSIFEIRVPLEKTAVTLATLRATPAELAVLRNILAELETAEAEKKYGDVVSLDQHFHEQVRKMAKNPYLDDILENTHNIALRFWYLYKDGLSQEYRSVHGLQAVFDAMEKKNAKKAAEAMGSHVIEFLAAFDKMKAQVFRNIADI